MNKIITLLISTIILTGCVGMAKLSDFSQTASAIDFEQLSREYKLAETPSWTLSTSNEYYFVKISSVDEQTLFEAIKTSLQSYSYAIIVSNNENKCLIGKRGIVANEWSSITAVYYKIESNEIQVYVKTKISQDVTGGWGENRAMMVGQRIERELALY